MIGILLGIPGKLQTLLTRITSTGGANLDSKLDATVSSRAAASTALSTVQWTNDRAVYLDVLNTGGIAQEANPMLAAPKASAFVTNENFAPTQQINLRAHGLTRFQTNSSTYVSAINYTGSGVLLFLAPQNADSGTAAKTACKLTIDGVVVEEQTVSAATYTLASTMVGSCIMETGGSIVAGYAPEPIPFKTSIKIEVKDANAGTGVAQCYYRLYKVT